MKTSQQIKIALIIAILAMAAFGGDAYEWKNTVSMQGRGTRQSCVFPLWGERWRVRFMPKSKGSVKVELLDENGNVVSTPINQRSLDMPWTVTGPINPSLKSAAMRVEGTVNGWSCTIEQFVNHTGGWELHRWNQLHRDDKNLERFAMWTGEASDEIEIPVTVESKKWRVLFETFEAGKVKVELIDNNGKCHLLNYHLSKGTSDGWVFSSGDFILRVSSVGSPWAVSFETDKGFSESKFVK